jgi:hypothetical protein
MESSGTRFAPAIVMFFLACVAVGQSVSPEPTGRTPVVHAIDCSHPEPWDGGFTLYQDKVDGFHFMYPSILNREASLVFTDQPCGNFFHSGEIINMEVNLPSAYMEPVVSQYRRDSGVSVATQVYNQLKWVTYSAPGWVESCTFWNREQVCIYGGMHPPVGQISDAVLNSVHEIVSTFVIHPSDRLDSRIAAVKVGQQYGRLKVRRVVTKEMKDRTLGKYSYGSYGEVDFTGTLTLVGTMEDDGTMNSGPHWIFYTDFEDVSQWPFDLGRELLGSIEFNNGYLVRKQLDKIPPSAFSAAEPVLTVLVKNIAVVFYPEGSRSIVTADFVSMVQ